LGSCHNLSERKLRKAAQILRKHSGVDFGARQELSDLADRIEILAEEVDHGLDQSLIGPSPTER